MTRYSIGTDPVSNYNLPQRWPDSRLSKFFLELLTVYQRLCAAYLEESGNPAIAVREGYEMICRWIKESLVETSDSRGRSADSHIHKRSAVRSVVLNLKENYGSDWLQSLASLLGMLMHFSVDEQSPSLLVNHRRPQKPFSTYPTSPAVARLVADAIVTHLLKKPVPAVCHRFIDAERYAQSNFNFRVLDPSMESGQMLLEIALSYIRKIYHKHSPQSKAGKYLASALLEKLCLDCLWGIDRNELATMAVSVLFSLLGAQFGMTKLVPKHLLTTNALDWFNQRRISKFDGIVNNPPWGEILRPIERKRLRKRFSTIKYRSDTYVAFCELAIQLLRPAGILALILPSQAVAAKYTAQLRELFLRKIGIDQMILLPRAAFANSTTRGFVLIGRVLLRPAPACCHVTTYPIEKRFDAIGQARSFTVSADALRHAGAGSWWPLLNVLDSKTFNSKTIRLEQIANIAPGVKLYSKGQGVPPQTSEVVRRRSFTLSKPIGDAVPAIRGRDVYDFQLSDPQLFVKFGKWLARVGNHNSLRKSTRIFVRELCRRDGKLTAAIAKDGFIPLHGVLTVVPKMIDITTLVCILNSKMVAKYVRTHTTSFSKVDFQKITISELRQLPIPIAAIIPSYRSVLGLGSPNAREAFLCQRLTTLVQELSDVTSINNVNAEELRSQLDAVVSEMYNLVEENGNA